MMKNFTKLMLTAILLVAGVGGVNSVSASEKTVYIKDYSKQADQNSAPFWAGSLPTEASIKVEGGLLVINNTQAAAEVYSLQLHVGSGISTTAGLEYKVKIEYKTTGDGELWLGLGNWTKRSTKYGVNLTASDDFQTLTSSYTDLNQTATDNFVMWQSGKLVGTIYIKKVEVIEIIPDVVSITEEEKYEAPEGTTDIKNLTGTNTVWASTVVYPKELAVQGAAFGNGEGSSESNHVNIDGYDYICFQVTTATNNTAGLRVWIWDGTAGGSGSVVTLYAKPIAEYATATWTEASKITGVGTYVAKVSGYKYLKGVKAANDYGSSAAVVSMAYMCTGDAPVAYTSTGETTVYGTGNLTNDKITYFDVTGLITSGQTLNPANPNALFKANSGKLTNDHNVIVSGECDQLALSDGYPFKAPATFTATKKPTYDRTFTASTNTTVCLPFALTETEAATLGTFYGLSTFDGSTLHLTPVAAPLANTPYLVIPANTGLTLSETGKSIAATPASLGASITDVEFIGTLESIVIPASETGTGENDYSYYAYNDGSLVKIVTNAATLPAFRGYFKVKNSAISSGSNARRLGVTFDNNATGITNVKKANGKAVYFDLQGRRVSKPNKGLYVVNGKKVVF